ncbi:stemmadenine O-acetyltransferase-like [Tripterygium wilfordii]|uniref:stemmadenine O-acetyltransferase-like n=1 Tax=Tripterygium wilfordii TaxID=458696 RepID=UPI0018F82883|nr:stemmadenine O-acetyltransferase-like [Tripterygium wilfordii]
MSKRSQVLKQSLSSTLTLYYPIAEETICCETTPGGNVVMIQETVFACGGFAIGIVTPHHIFDATSSIVFLKTWATMVREGVAIPPDFNSSFLFPQNPKFPNDVMSSIIPSQVFGRDGNFVFRRFVFEGSAVSNLKSKAASSGVRNPTRVEVVLAFLFRCVMSALKAKYGAQKSVLMSTSVNLRSRAMPPLPKTSVGCLVLLVPVLIGEETDLCSFVGRVRESVSTINGDFLKSLQGAEGMQRFLEFATETRETYSKALSDGAEFMVFNSWCNAGMYNVDFGWGKPIWFPSIPTAVRGSVIGLLDARMDNGIEAWMSLEEEIMYAVEHDEELLSLASVNPSPLGIDSLMKSNL